MKKLEQITANIPLERLEQICNAEREGRLVVLPCKVGDTIWSYSEFGGTIVPYTVGMIHCFEDTMQVDCCWYSHDECMEEAEFEPDDLGETVFLTKEQAEKALKGE